MRWHNANPPTGRPSISVGERRQSDEERAGKGRVDRLVEKIHEVWDSGVFDDETPEEEATGRALDRQRQIDAERRLADLDDYDEREIERKRIASLSDPLGEW